MRPKATLACQGRKSYQSQWLEESGKAEQELTGGEQKTKATQSDRGKSELTHVELQEIRAIEKKHSDYRETDPTLRNAPPQRDK